jgi:hypothetical protein
MKICNPTRISASASPEALASAIEGSNGVLLITDLPKAPFAEIRSAFDGLASRQDLISRLNEAYKSNLVYKDSFADGKGGPTVDAKRVLDLSPERLEEITKNDPELDLLKVGSLKDTLDYWEHLRSEVAPKITRAVSDAIGSEDVAKDAAFNYRMVDYYSRDSSGNQDIAVAPRCGDHRDFGSYTLVFPSSAGLQLSVDGEWIDMPPPEDGTAIMLFGWCTQIRSNGRIPAILHRVADSEGVDRRTSAVLFCAPKKEGTPLEPVVRPGEERVYTSGIKAGQLRGSMRRKWQKREGTLSEEGRVLEEREILATNMHTQDDVVKRMVVAK